MGFGFPTLGESWLRDPTITRNPTNSFPFSITALLILSSLSFLFHPPKRLMWTSIDTLLDPTKILDYLPKKAKIQILIENPDPMFISETRIKGISNRPWPNDYNGIMNQRYKIWRTKKRAKAHIFWFLFNDHLYYNECMLLIRHDWK